MDFDDVLNKCHLLHQLTVWLNFLKQF